MSNRPTLTIAIALLLPAGMLFGQAPAAAPAFEVASIKAAAPLNPQLIMSGKMHMGVNIDAARVDIGNLSLMQLLCLAYKVKPYQVTGPDWMNTERFDVLAKFPDGATKDQLPDMLQALLAERFKLTLHRDSKEHAVYALVVGKNGPKLKESAPDADAPSADSGPPAGLPPGGPPPGGPGFGPPGGSGQMRMNPDGKGVSVSGGPMGAVRVSMGQDGFMHMETAKATMAMFADMLSQFVDRPVVDMTELKGTYQVALDLSMDDMRNAAKAAGLNMGPGGMPPPPPGGEPGRGPLAAAASSDPAPSAVFANVQQLGLKLEPRKTPVTTLVIDHAEKMPIEN
jgi:uncharacterized protein (TIGR03435 family)